MRLCLIRAGHNTNKPLMEHLGYSSQSTLRRLINHLKDFGLLEETANMCGTLRLTAKGQQMVSMINLFEMTPDGKLDFIKYLNNDKRSPNHHPAPGR